MHLEEPQKLIQPRDHKAKILIWADLTVSDMDVINDAVTVDQLKRELAQIFHIEDYQENLKNGVLLDLFYYTIQFCRDNKFSKEQTSTFFSIVKKTHEVCIETPFGNVEHCFRFFRELVLCHAVKRPPYSIDIFTADDVQKITEYVINSYFRHFKMYKYVFTPLVRLDLSMTYAGMPETPATSDAGDLTARTEEVSQEGADTEKEEEIQEGSEMQETGQKRSRSNSPATLSPEAPIMDKEESPAAKELRGIIKKHLEDEIKKLKLTVDEQIKQSEQSMSKKIDAVEGAANKGGRGSGKGKRK